MDYVKYIVNGQIVYLQYINGEWVQTLTAPETSGTYDIGIEVNISGISTFIDSSDERLGFQLIVNDPIESQINVSGYLPSYLKETSDFSEIINFENKAIEDILLELDYILKQIYLSSASPETILKIENYLGIKGEGTLNQRKSYILALMKKGDKLSEKSIKKIVNIITGSDAIVNFYTTDDQSNPLPGSSVIYIQVLSPDNNKDYKYDDIYRAIYPLVPAHLNLIVFKYYSTWSDVALNYESWQTLKDNASNWKQINDYIPPQG